MADAPKPQEQDPDARLRSAIQDTLVVLRKLTPVCGSIEDLTLMLELALTSDGQLTLIKRELSPLAFAK